LEYKKGYVNIDAFDNTVADQMMSVTHLEFDNKSFSRIDCIQVLEHLGAAKSIYALSEIYRVLRSRGLLFLETPDLVGSFKSFITGEENDRKMIMNWIYGLDIPGMSHKYGFPKELLEKMLHDAGFIDVKIVQLKPKSVHPSLRATCNKGDSAVFEVISQFRKRLVEEKCVNLNHQVEVIEKEALIQELIQLTLSAGPSLEDKCLRAIVEASAVCSPKIGLLFLDTIKNSNLVTHYKVNEFIEILERLDSVGFVNVLTHLFMEMPIKPGFQSETFDIVIKLGKEIVRKLISGNQSAIDDIKNTASTIQIENYNDYFSIIGLELISNRKIAVGLKYFALNQLKEAKYLLKDSIRFNRDSAIAFWNLARLSLLEQDQAKMNQYYSTVRNLLILKHPTNHRNYVKTVDQERRNAEKGIGKIYSEPLYTY